MHTVLIISRLLLNSYLNIIWSNNLYRYLNTVYLICSSISIQVLFIYILHIYSYEQTDDPRVQLKCNKTLPIKVIKLLDCFGNKSVTEFVLKVSRFPEIASLPSFHSEIPVYFVGEYKIFNMIFNSVNIIIISTVCIFK